MIRYHVKRNKKSRNTLRYLGVFLFVFGAFLLYLFFSGMAAKHVFGAIIGALIGLYGIYLFIHTFEEDKYDIDYEFGDTEMTVKHVRGETVYTYDQIDDVSLIVPENEMIYSLIFIRAGKKKYLIPFSYKKDACDQIYKHLTSRVTEKRLQEEIEAAAAEEESAAAEEESAAAEESGTAETAGQGETK